MHEDAILNAIYKYTLNKKNQDFDVKVIGLLVRIYGELQIVKPYLEKNYEQMISNLKLYGFPQKELDKLNNSLKKYQNDNDMNAFLTVYKIVIDMIVYKYKQEPISPEEVKYFESIFFEGLHINALNKYWDKALYKMNKNLALEEKNNNTYSLKGKSLEDLKNIDENLYNRKKREVDDYNAQIEEKQSLTSGNGFVDLLLYFSFVATEIMSGALIAINFIKR